MGFLNNPAVLTICPILWGLAVKYNPAWKNVPNAIIPYATAVVAFLVKVFSPEAAQASPMEMLVVAKTLGIGGFFGGLLGAGLSAGWQAIQNSLIYEVFLRHPANAVLPTAHISSR
jgi:hypothetical protein